MLEESAILASMVISENDVDLFKSEDDMLNVVVADSINAPPSPNSDNQKWNLKRGGELKRSAHISLSKPVSRPVSNLSLSIPMFLSGFHTIFVLQSRAWEQILTSSQTEVPACTRTHFSTGVAEPCNLSGADVGSLALCYTFRRILLQISMSLLQI